MQLPESTLILGDQPITQALKQVLELFGTECYVFEAIPDEKEDNEGKKEEFIDVLTDQDPRLVIEIAQNHLHLVHKMRTVLNWQGCFIAIVSGKEEYQNLLNTGLLGDDTRFQFSKVDGHAAVLLSQPDFVYNLLNTIQQTPEITLNYWWDLLDTWHFPKNIEELEKSIAQNQEKEAIEKANELLHAFRITNWSKLLIQHEDKHLVHELENKYPPNKPLDCQDCTIIAQKIKNIIGKICIKLS